jgi:hypothetical protein
MRPSATRPAADVARAMGRRRIGAWAGRHLMAGGRHGTQAVTAPAKDPWTLVVMDANGSRPVAARVEIGASLPALPWVGLGALALGCAVLVGGVLLVVVPTRRARG